MAFQWAHEADPQALLFYNDNGAEGLNSKSQAIYSMVQRMQELGIPIHGVGFQMHVWIDGPPTPQDLHANMQRLAALGLLVQITEMDVRTQYSRDTLSVKETSQAEMYRRIFSVCLEERNCTAFTTWGLTDRFSWIPGYTGKADFPLLFDQEGLPKPAYYALLDSLQSP
jgi:endo-1,4-beta-xylanase